jgi:glycosidase
MKEKTIPNLLIGITIFCIVAAILIGIVLGSKSTYTSTSIPSITGSSGSVPIPIITNDKENNALEEYSYKGQCLCEVYPKTSENSTFIASYSLINDYHYINGYSDIRYNNDRTKATVYVKSFINETEYKALNVYYSFDGGQTYYLENYKDFSRDYYSTDETLIVIKVNYETIGEKFLRLQPILFIWNAKLPTIVRNKHAIVELFGWDYISILKEIDVIVKAGWTGIRLFPVFEHVMYLPNFKKNNNPWYTMYQPVSYNFNSVHGSREQLQQVINKANSLNLNVYVDIIFNHTTYYHLYYEQNRGSGYNTLLTSGGVDYVETNNIVVSTLDKTKNTPFDATKWQFPGIPLYKYNFNENEGDQDIHNQYETQCRRLDNLLSIELSSDNVLDRQSACLVDLLSRGVSGFRFDAARHMNQYNVATLFNKVYKKMGDYLPEYHTSWFELYIKPCFPWEQEFNSYLNQNINKDNFKFWYCVNCSDFICYTDPTTRKSTKQSIKQFDCHDIQTNNDRLSLVYGYKDNIDGYIDQIVDMFNDDDGISTKLLLSSFWIDKNDSKDYNFPNGLGTNPDYYISGYVPDNLNEMNKNNQSPGQFTRVHRDSKIVNAMNAYLRRD